LFLLFLNPLFSFYSNGDIVSFDQHNIRSTSDPPPDLDIAKFQKLFFFTEILAHWEKEHMAKKQFPLIFENLTSTFMRPLMTPSDFVTITNKEGKNQKRKINKTEQRMKQVLFSSKEIRLLKQQFLRDAKKSGKSPAAIKAGLEKIMILKLNAHEKERKRNKEDQEEEDNNQKDRGTGGGEEDEEGYVFREDLLSKFHQIPFSSYYTAHLNTSDSSTLPEELIQGLEYLQSLIDSSSSSNSSSSSDSVDSGFSYLEDDDLFDPVLQEFEEQLASRSKAILSLQQTHFGNPLTRNNESELIKEVMDYMQYGVKDKKKFLKEQFHLLKMNSSLEVIQGKGENDGELKGYCNSNRPITSYSFGWRMFLDVIKVLEKFRAISKIIRPEKSEELTLEEENPLKVNYPKNITGEEEETETKKTEEDEENEDDKMKQKKLDYQFNPFGEMIGSFNTENDLWIAIVVDQLARQQSSSDPLTVHQFAAVIASLVADSPKAVTAEYSYGPSRNVSDFLEDTLYPYYRKLKKIQERENLDFPMFLTNEVTGIIEKWSKGMEWRDLVTKATDLDQGDLYRILKRTIELLRSIESSASVPEDIARIARRAHDQINRYPLTDELTEQPQYGDDSTIADTMVMTNGTSIVGTVVGETSDVELSLEELRELGDAEEEDEEEEEEIEMEYEEDDEELLEEEDEEEECDEEEEDDDHEDLGTEKDRMIGSHGSRGKGFSLDRTKSGRSTHSHRKQYDEEEIEDEDENDENYDDEEVEEDGEEKEEESEEVNDERTNRRRRF
jgi:hypothetical protein